MSAEDLVHPSFRERVTVAPPPDWVTPPEDAASADEAGAGTNAILLMDSRHHAGLRENYERLVYRLDTTQEVHHAAQWRRSFDPHAEHLVIHALIVRRGGTVRDHARPEAVRLMQREESLDRLVIDGWVTAFVLFEDVRVGDIVDVSYTVRTTARLLPERYWLFDHVPTHLPLRRFRHEVRFPTSEAMRWKSSADDFAPAVEERGGETIWTWNVDDVPMVELEPGVPGWLRLERWLQVSDIASWGEVATGTMAAWHEQFDSPELQTLAEEIAAAAATPAERCSLALTFIQDEIRYLSVDTGLGGQIPAPPGMVLQRRFGDCKDKSFLAAHLLRRLGIPARPVLVSTVQQHAVDALLPMPDAFNHAIVEYEIDGKRRWVDATLAQQGGGTFARVVPKFRRGLPIAPDVTGLVDQPAPPNTRDILELHETFFVDTAFGVSTLRVLQTARGRDADALRRRLAFQGEEAVARERMEGFRAAFPHIERVGRLEWRDDREGNELLLGEVFDAKHLLIPGADPKTATFAYGSGLLRSILAPPPGVRRKHPLAIAHPCNVEHRISIESPAIQRSQGESGKNSGFPFTLSYTTTSQPGRYSVHYSYRSTAEAVDPDKFESYRTKVGTVWDWTAIKYTLPTGVAVPWSNRQHAALLPKPQPEKPADGIVLPPLSAEIAPPLGFRDPANGDPVEAVASPRPVAQVKEVHADAEAAPEEELAEASSPRRRRRRRPTERNLEGLWVGLTIVLVGAAGLAMVLFVKRDDGPPAGPIASGLHTPYPARAENTPPPKPIRLDVPGPLPDPSVPPGDSSFFPSKPGPFSPNPATPPPVDRRGLLPGT
jgi:transglutaminase-like putative cysteine protease